MHLASLWFAIAKHTTSGAFFNDKPFSKTTKAKVEEAKVIISKFNFSYLMVGSYQPK